jgi:predicted ATPase/class 3 adenylate cyclase
MVELPSGTVTFLFTDLEGSTRLWEEYPEGMKGALARHDDLMRRLIEAHAGYVVKATGDGFHAAFGSADGAVAAAVAIQTALAAEVWPDGVAMRVRMGVHVGETEERDGDYFGSAVNQAARLMGVAHGGQIVCSGVVAALVGERFELVDLGMHRLRDLETVMHVWQVITPGQRQSFPPPRSLDAYLSNLPVELSAFVGRERDVDALVGLLGRSRNVTVIGVGGVGKTRLALRVASEALPRYRDGVWFCDLAPVRRDEEVLDAVAAALGYVAAQGMTVEEGLRRFLEHKTLLLVLDNCEHLVASVAAFVTATLRAAREVAVLATSRESLRVPGEAVYPLGSLGLPASADRDAVLGSESGLLFALRAADARGGFVVDRDNGEAVRGLCVRLDGIPLAIELAAARTIAMSPNEIAQRLDRQFRLLTDGARSTLGRHETLRAAVDWSYDLLGVNERRLLQRCTVFVGGFDLEAAMALAVSLDMDEIEVADCIGSLVAKSLLERAEHNGRTRYRLLEMVRQYAAEHLDRNADRVDVHTLHGDHYLAVSRASFEGACTAAAWDALDNLERDAANVAAAGRWFLESGRVAELLEFFHDLPFLDSTALPASVIETLGRIAAEAIAESSTASVPGFAEACFMAAMRHFLDGNTKEYRRYSVLGNAHHDDSPRLLMLAASAAMFDGAVDDAITIGTRAVDLARNTASTDELAFGLALLAVFEQFGFSGAAATHASEAIALARQSGSPIALLYPLMALAMALRDTDPPRALAAADECMRIDRSRRRTWSTACQSFTAQMRLDTGDTSGAFREVRDMVLHLARHGDRAMLSAQLLVLADMIVDRSPSLALQLAALYESDAIAAWGDFTYQESVASLADQYPDELATARVAAAAMSEDEAIISVLDALDQLIALAEASPAST